MSPQEKYIDILESYKDSEKKRPVIDTPFIQQGYACATDGRIAIAIPLKTCGKLKYLRHEEPDVVGLIPPDDREGEVRTVQELKDIPEPPSLENGLGDQCPECKGLGSVKWRYKDHSKMDECPRCDGYGIKNYVPEPQVKYAGYWFQYKYLKLIRNTCVDLGITEFKVNPGLKTSFRLDGGIVILLMACPHWEYNE